MKKIYYTLFLFFILCFSANAKETNFRKLETTLRIGASDQNVGFDTPVTHSILEWNTETIDFGLDLKYNFSDKTFTMFEYTYSEVKAGQSTDDDINNGAGYYSWHGVEGRVNDYKLKFGYRLVNPGSFSLFATAGLFHKEVETITKDGVLTYNSYSMQGPGNETNSQFSGLTIGPRFEFKTENTKNVLQTELLIPLRYKGKQIWYGRDPDLHWELRNNQDNYNGSGFRLKAEHGYKIKDSFLKYVKLYSYYEEIEVIGLKEIENGVTSKGGTSATVINGSVNYKAYGGGLAFEF